MKKSILLFSVFLYGFVFCVKGQTNLVPNPSFEDTVSCPIWVGNFTLKDWIKPSWGSPDNFHSCSSGQLGVPQNVFGWQSARTGNGYVGAHGSDLSGSNSREYIQCQLNSPLTTGKKYEISFWVSRADSSTYACNNIGAYLSTNAVSISSTSNMPYSPQVFSANIISDALNWVQIIDTIQAVGGEQYLTIGVFSDDFNTNYTSVSGGWQTVFHYYYDDVSVTEILPNHILEVKNKNSIKLFPNPSDNFIQLISTEIIENYTLYNHYGRIIYSKQCVNNENEIIDTSIFPSGIYYMIITTENYTSKHSLIINH
jgi:hypothetical protein